MRDSTDPVALRRQLRRTIGRLRAEPGSTPRARRGRELAIRGFGWALRSTQSRIDFVENDSGNVSAATIDAMNADRFLANGARLLRAAGRELGVRVGTLRGR